MGGVKSLRRCPDIPVPARLHTLLAPLPPPETPDLLLDLLEVLDPLVALLDPLVALLDPLEVLDPLVALPDPLVALPDPLVALLDPLEVPLPHLHRVLALQTPDETPQLRKISQ